jgi:hypothetical protein
MQLVFSSAIFWLEHQRANPRTQKAQICFNKKQKKLKRKHKVDSLHPQVKCQNITCHKGNLHQRNVINESVENLMTSLGLNGFSNGFLTNSSITEDNSNCFYCI